MVIVPRRFFVIKQCHQSCFLGQLLRFFFADLVFGTVPAPAENLSTLTVTPHALIYDLGGGLPATLSSLEGEAVTVLPLRGAPGVFAPLAAGEIYGGAILDFINTL